MHMTITTTEPAHPARLPVMAWTVDEAAEIIRVKPSWLCEQARQRKIPFTMLGGAYHFTAGHLDTIIKQREHLPRPAHTTAATPRRSPRTTAPTAVPERKVVHLQAPRQPL
jgi:hypothetical protein